MLPGWAGGAGQSWQSWGNRGGGAIADRHRHGPRHRPARAGNRGQASTRRQSRGQSRGNRGGQSRTGIDIGTIAGSRGRVSRSRTGIDTAPGIDQPESPAARHQAGPPLPPPRGNRVAIADRHRHGNRGQASTRRQSRGQSRGNRGGQSRTGIDIGTIAGSRGRVSRSRTGIDTAPGIDQPKSPAARHQAGPPLPPPRVLAPRGRSASGRSIAGFSARRLRRGLRRRFGRFLARRRRSLVDLGEVVVGQ